MPDSWYIERLYWSINVASSRFYFDNNLNLAHNLNLPSYPTKQCGAPHHSRHVHYLSSQVLPSLPLGVCTFPLRSQHDTKYSPQTRRPFVSEYICRVQTTSVNWYAENEDQVDKYSIA